LLEVKEHVPVAYRATLSARVFRIIGQSLKALGLFPTPEQIITSESFEAAIEDAEPVQGGRKTMALFTGVRTSGHTWDIASRGIVQENVSFVAISVKDEFENP